VFKLSQSKRLVIAAMVVCLCSVLYAVTRLVNTDDLQWSDGGQLTAQLPSGQLKTYSFFDSELFVELTYSSTTDASVIINKDSQLGINFDAAVTLHSGFVRFTGQLPGQFQIVSVNDTPYFCLLHTVRSDTSECRLSTQPMSVGHVRLTRGIDALFLPGALIVGWLLSRWRITRSKNSAKHSSVEVRRSNMHHFLPAVIPLALSIVLLWRTPITDPLWPSISPPVDSFMHAWHQIEWHSPASALVYVLRGVVSELVGATYESRVYFSMVTVGVSLSFYYACRFVWSACVDRSAALIVGMLAVCNGYFLQRLVLGHDRQLLGYALLPWIIGYIVRVIMHKKHRDLYIAVLLAVVAGIIAPHYVPIALVVFIVSLPFTYSVWGSAVRGLSVRWGAALAVATTICAVRVFGVTERVSEFGSDGLLAWAPRSDEFYGVITSV